VTGDDPPPIEEGWAEIAEPMDYTDSFVSSATDGVRRFTANADDRPEDEIERADTALAGVAAQSLGTGSTPQAYVYTTDVAAGRAVEAVFDGDGFKQPPDGQSRCRSTAASGVIQILRGPLGAAHVRSRQASGRCRLRPRGVPTPSFA